MALQLPLLQRLYYHEFELYACNITNLLEKVTLLLITSFTTSIHSIVLYSGTAQEQ
jgi:hypothetical protein